jgi:ubiquinone/menaquinone biosynthesis C-methylase UbiE
MSKYLLILIFIGFGIIFQTCKETPQFERQAVVLPQIAEEVSNSKPKEKLYGDERSDWQKPQFIINQMGDLTGKTIADIGSGALGYFTFKLIGQTSAEKVIAIDVDEEAITTLKQLKSNLSESHQARLEVRLAKPNDPKISKNEIDIALIVNTVSYIQNRINYFKELKSKLKEGGSIIIVDFKTKRIPEYVEAPLYKERVYLDIIEEQLYTAGFTSVEVDDTSLEYQYTLTATF